MQHSPILVWFSPQAHHSAATIRALQDSTLCDLGFGLVHGQDLAELYRQVDRHVVRDGIPIAVVLAGGHQNNCAAAAYLRSLHPSLPIVAIPDLYSDSILIELLRCGVDSCCARDASSNLVAAMVTRLFVRANPGLSITGVQTIDRDTGYWTLAEQGWLLIAPQGESVSLTTGERAFMSTLLSAPSLRATHQQLSVAVASSYASASGQHGTLGVLLSRLRRKVARHGLGVPVKSVHNWGYMFSGSVR